TLKRELFHFRFRILDLDRIARKATGCRDAHANEQSNSFKSRDVYGLLRAVQGIRKRADAWLRRCRPDPARSAHPTSPAAVAFSLRNPSLTSSLRCTCFLSEQSPFSGGCSSSSRKETMNAKTPRTPRFY